MDSGFLSHSEEETFEFARGLAFSLTLPAHILLFGELGAGKTTFTKGLAAGFGVVDIDAVSNYFARSGPPLRKGAKKDRELLQLWEKIHRGLTQLCQDEQRQDNF